MKPLAYGYMRVFCDVTEADIYALEQRIESAATTCGFQFATTFQETVSGSVAAFCELIEELQHAEATHVIVPGLEHFSRNSLLQDLMVMQLEAATRAEVHTFRDLAGLPVDAGNE